MSRVTAAVGGENTTQSSPRTRRRCENKRSGGEEEESEGEERRRRREKKNWPTDQLQSTFAPWQHAPVKKVGQQRPVLGQKDQPKPCAVSSRRLRGVLCMPAGAVDKACVLRLCNSPWQQLTLKITSCLMLEREEHAKPILKGVPRAAVRRKRTWCAESVCGRPRGGVGVVGGSSSAGERACHACISRLQSAAGLCSRVSTQSRAAEILRSR